MGHFQKDKTVVTESREVVTWELGWGNFMGDETVLCLCSNGYMNLHFVKLHRITHPDGQFYCRIIYNIFKCKKNKSSRNFFPHCCPHVTRENLHPSSVSSQNAGGPLDAACSLPTSHSANPPAQGRPQVATTRTPSRPCWSWKNLLDLPAVLHVTLPTAISKHQKSDHVTSLPKILP